MKKKYGLFGLLCCSVYFISYASRINFSAVLAEIIVSEGISKSAISIVITMCAISYGIGQPISGFLGDKISPMKLIFTGLLVTGACNLLMPICTSIAAMSAVWFVNGFAQAFMWPPLSKLMYTYLNDEQYSKTSANVSSASSIGSICVYIIAPVLINVSGWRAVFVITGAAALLEAALVKFAFPRVTANMPIIESSKSESGEQAKGGDSIGKVFKKYGLVMICLAIVAQGALRDGITTWLPTCLSEVFHMETTVSILISVILPIFAVVSFQLSAYVQRRWIQNTAKLAAYMYIICAVLVFLWGKVYASGVVLSLLLTAASITMIHGINFLLTSPILRHFTNCGHISALAGILNSCTYIGSALSTYAIAKISETAGWQTTIYSWCAMALFGFLMCLLCIPKFKKER